MSQDAPTEAVALLGWLKANNPSAFQIVAEQSDQRLRWVGANSRHRRAHLTVIGTSCGCRVIQADRTPHGIVAAALVKRSRREGVVELEGRRIPVGPWLAGSLSTVTERAGQRIPDPNENLGIPLPFPPMCPQPSHIKVQCKHRSEDVPVADVLRAIPKAPRLEPRKVRLNELPKL